jgi:hypothetical protein
MEYVIIQGGVAQDMSNNVNVIDLDNLEDSLAGPDELTEAYNSLIGSGFGWAQEEIAHFWAVRGDTYKCARCGAWVVDEGGVFVDLTGGDVCADLEGVEGEHTL